MILSNTTLNDISSAVKKPTYERSTLSHSLVHIGLGHFHRSHFLTYLDTLNNAKDAHDGVFEIDIPPANEIFTENLRKQDYLYSVLSWGSDGSKDIRINGPIIGYANATKEPETVLEKLSAPETKLISLTITEKGYYYLDDEQTLNWDNAGVIHDLEATDSYPVTPVGYLSRALLKRKENNCPVTIMSCDNIPENGKVLKCCILQFCEKKYPDIISWIEKNVAFPCTMVDRITPGTTQSDIETIEKAGSYHDNCPVHCEDFLQWVIEDSHTTDIPDFAKAGAMIVKDVKPYELMKIRLLNGSHSALSYPAYLMGIRTVDEAATNPLIHDFIRNHYMEELTATLPQVPGIDVSKYKDMLMYRFSNVYIRDTILRLASDGSKKIANAIAKPLQETLGTQKKHAAMILALAFWARFCSGKDENGIELPIDDPQKDALLRTWNNSEKFLQNIGITNGLEDLAKELAVALKAIEEKGTKQALSDFLK
jgi:mannitol-1-phosphate/altronate dehydrogenase